MLSRLQLSQTFKSFQRTPTADIVSRMSLLQISPLRHATTSATQETNRVEEIEKLRKRAFEVQKSTLVRSRCRWTEEESKKLVELVKQHGEKWSFISTMFVNRPATAVMNRYKLLQKGSERGPWSKQELSVLKLLGNGRSFEQIDNWEEIQASLPHYRPAFLIKQKYKAMDPRYNRGRWSDEETDRLIQLVQKHGENDMDLISDLLGTRSTRQCFERWHWQLKNTRKGRFTLDEDALILDAVEKYGENFAVIQKVTGIPRTPRHISQHYHNKLNPTVDLSAWTPEEEMKVYQTCVKNDRDMQKTKKELNSKRSIRDMWNHYFKLKRSMGFAKTEPEA
ncbi:hypothetical protein BD560DRAFT_411006 [Blakeslea trispora]|nr:hypothetical protein BD560DRAFT_411006 [Blakeslea trispora]